jgi:putative flippase GtrA
VVAASTAAPGAVGQLMRFVLIGGFCALLDYGTYQTLRALGMDGAPLVDIARAISFIVGTTTAYFLNRRFTFAAGRRSGAGQVSGFVLLYATTFFVAVGVNRWMLLTLPASAWESTLAWVISQGTATAINFLMLKFVVFRTPADART